MERFEMVEKLREKANVSYDEARTALERCNWDLLDAMIYLENEGRVHAEAGQRYSTRKEEPSEKKKEPEAFKENFRRLLKKLKEWLDKCNKTICDVNFRGKTLFNINLSVLILLLVFLWPYTLIAMVVSLFFGVRYTLRGEGVEGINKVMDKAAKTAEKIKSDVVDPDKKERTVPHDPHDTVE